MVLLANVWGCATWTETNQKTLGLPKPRMSSDSVVLDITFVQVPSDENAEEETIWNEIDETRIRPEVRRHLSENGMRCGLVGFQMPDGLRQWLDQRETHAWRPDSPRPWHHLQIRAGHRCEIVASKVVDCLIVLTKDEDGVGGMRYDNAKCVFAIQAFPQGDGRARIELIPEIHHGEPKRDWKGETGMWQNDVSHTRRIYESLCLEAMLSPGESLAMACTQTARGLGAHFFSTPGDAMQTGRKLLIVRLAQTQYDDLFSP